MRGWINHGTYNGLKDADRLFLKRFNQEWRSRFVRDPVQTLHEAVVWPTLDHSDYVRRFDAMNKINVGQSVPDRFYNPLEVYIRCLDSSKLPKRLKRYR